MNYELKRRVDGESFAIQAGKTAVCIYGEGDSTEFQAAGFFPAVEITVPVKIIAEQRVPQCREVCSDLMGTSRNQMNAET